MHDPYERSVLGRGRRALESGDQHLRLVLSRPGVGAADGIDRTPPTLAAAESTEALPHGGLSVYPVAAPRSRSRHRELRWGLAQLLQPNNPDRGQRHGKLYLIGARPLCLELGYVNTTTS